MSRIYKILPRWEWDEALAARRFNGSLVDVQDGFIHFSTAEQAQDTARRHFAGQIRIGFGWDREIARQLLALGVVSTVSWVFANVIFLYADRFLIGIFFPLSLIGYYTMVAMHLTAHEMPLPQGVNPPLKKRR